MTTGNTPLLGQVRLSLETNPGMQLLMAETAVAAIMSLTTQPSALCSMGMHLIFVVKGNIATGSITASGKKPGNSSQTSIAYPVALAPQNGQGFTVYATKEVFTTVSANGLTLTGFGLGGTPNGTLTVYGVQAGKFLLPRTVDAEEKYGQYSPKEARGIYWQDIRLRQMGKNVDVPKFDGSLYPGALWFGYMYVSNNPVVTTVPATPTTLLAATAVSAAPYTLSGTLVGNGEYLIFAIAGNGTAGTISVAGTDNFGNAASETISVKASDTLVYSTKRYSAVNAGGITVSGLDNVATVAITGVICWIYTFTNDGVNIGLSSAALEWFDGTDGVVLPYFIGQDAELDWEKEKEMILTCKGECQEMITVGDTTQTVMGTNPFPAISQPTDMPYVSWPALFYIDTLPGGTAFTTQNSDFLSMKLKLSTGQKGYPTGDGNQFWSRTTRDGSKPATLAFDATVDFQNDIEYNRFKQNGKAIFAAQFQGNFIGSRSGTYLYEYWRWTLPAKYQTFKRDTSKDKVEAAITGVVEYDFTLGFAYQLQVQCQVPPNYNL